MTIAITGATGHIGGEAARVLLDQGEDVVLLVRDAAKLHGTALAGARVLEGDLGDAAYVRRATEGADALFWLTPPQLTAADVCEWQLALARNATAAVTANGIRRVVNLSGYGAGTPTARGLLRGLGEVEAALDASPAHVTHLRPGWFMENLEPQWPAVLAGQPLRVAIDPQVPLPLIATRDIGRAAATALTQTTDAPRHVTLAGPDTLTGAAIATVLSEVLGHEVPWVGLPPAAMGDMFRSFGASEDAARLYVTLFEDFNRPDGPYASVPADVVRTATTLREWANAKRTED